MRVASVYPLAKQRSRTSLRVCMFQFRKFLGSALCWQNKQEVNVKKQFEWLTRKTTASQAAIIVPKPTRSRAASASDKGQPRSSRHAEATLFPVMASCQFEGDGQLKEFEAMPKFPVFVNAGPSLCFNSYLLHLL